MIKTTTITPFYNLLDELISRPEMFLGSRNLNLIRTFINGYKIALTTYNHKDFDLEHFNSFDMYVQNNLNNRTTIGWPELIESQCDSEDEAFNLFICLLSKYRASAPAHSK
ncbi:MAG: hypothetical protein COA33_003570 [Fluviicola sp.]|nr:hypothetical protein [Fluviicola sp.]